MSDDASFGRNSCDSCNHFLSFSWLQNELLMFARKPQQSDFQWLFYFVILRHKNKLGFCLSDEGLPVFVLIKSN